MNAHFRQFISLFFCSYRRKSEFVGLLYVYSTRMHGIKVKIKFEILFVLFFKNPLSLISCTKILAAYT
jgi:hypothetical protein